MFRKTPDDVRFRRARTASQEVTRLSGSRRRTVMSVGCPHNSHSFCFTLPLSQFVLALLFVLALFFSLDPTLTAQALHASRHTTSQSSLRGLLTTQVGNESGCVFLNFVSCSCFFGRVSITSARLWSHLFLFYLPEFEIPPPPCIRLCAAVFAFVVGSSCSQPVRVAEGCHQVDRSEFPAQFAPVVAAHALYVSS